MGNLGLRVAVWVVVVTAVFGKCKEWMREWVVSTGSRDMRMVTLEYDPTAATSMLDLLICLFFYLNLYSTHFLTYMGADDAVLFIYSFIISILQQRRQLKRER